MASGTLDVLSANVPDQPGSRTEILLPSWVPDWSMKRPVLSLAVGLGAFSSYNAFATEGDNDSPLTGENIFNAANGMRPELLETEYPEVLGIKGTLIDTIESTIWYSQVGADQFDAFVMNHIAPGLRYQAANKTRQSRIWLDFQGWKSLCCSSSAGPYKFTGEPMDRAFWRTVLLDRCLVRNGEGFCLQRLDPSKPGLVGIDNIPPKDEKEERALLHRIEVDDMCTLNHAWFAAHYTAQSFFRAKNGYIGICPPQAMQGDEIVVLTGSRVPFVVRRFGKYVYFVGEW